MSIQAKDLNLSGSNLEKVIVSAISKNKSLNIIFEQQSSFSYTLYAAEMVKLETKFNKGKTSLYNKEGKISAIEFFNNLGGVLIHTLGMNSSSSFGNYVNAINIILNHCASENIHMTPKTLYRAENIRLTNKRMQTSILNIIGDGSSVDRFKTYRLVGLSVHFNSVVGFCSSYRSFVSYCNGMDSLYKVIYKFKPSVPYLCGRNWITKTNKNGEVVGRQNEYIFPKGTTLQVTGVNIDESNHIIELTLDYLGIDKNTSTLNEIYNMKCDDIELFIDASTYKSYMQAEWNRRSGTGGVKEHEKERA